MHERTFVLRNRDVARNMFKFIGDLYQGSEAPEQTMEVIIREHKRDRSLAQNRLSFQWYRERAKQQGTTQDYEHRLCKLQYGCPILIADDADFAELFRRAIEPLDYEKRIAAMKYLPVTRLFKVRQMADYLTDIERDSAAKGIVLTHPEDLYWEAMGR